MEWSLSDGKELCEEIRSARQLREKLAFYNVGPFANVILGLDSARGHSLLIGLGGDVAYLNYRPNGSDPPYYSSVNPNSSTLDENVAIFEFGGSESEIPVRYCVPFPIALDAMEEYFETEQMPSIIQWERD